MFNIDEGLGEEIKNEREKVEMMEKKQLMMEEQLKIIQGSRAYEPTGIEELPFAPQLDIPRDFKVPKFDKYDGTTNPRIHLMSYCTKMGVWSRDERFFMHFFPESLTGPAADWYWRLEHAQIQSWGQLATLFLRQYSFNESLTPTRAQLEAMRKEYNESFREYAQRWRHITAQVQPPLGKREMIDYFLRILTTPFIEMMAASVYDDFSELIPVGERIEIVYKARKLSSY
ncbi:hypothetical protein L6164_036932 [Bauhinia variegata]|uniref:Uncharacterized protein n=1 Tax=Bauhinia variegata TaxID=167791 RepID=A0ACB9KIR5_BAUVA|nr:hypothetical protein L6164_036932 [Bauhinia variegata]